jgi:hypothetical protein
MFRQILRNREHLTERKFHLFFFFRNSFILFDKLFLASAPFRVKTNRIKSDT